MKLRKVERGDVAMLRHAELVLRTARDELRVIGARKACEAVRRALKSIGGAIRHAERCERAQEETCTNA